MSVSRLAYAASILIFGLMLLIDPALAGNKFETISSGVTGSFEVKSEHLKIIFYVMSGICYLGSVLSIVIPHNNPVHLNYTLWRMSAVIWFVIATVLVLSALFVV